MKGRELTESATGGPVAYARESSRRGLLSALKYSVLVLFLAAFVFAGGFAWFASYVGQLVTPANPQSADAIIVLTGGSARIEAALDLLKSGKGRRLLISGVHPSADRDDLQHASGGDPELFSCCVDIDYAALDTVGNAEESAKWVTSHAYNTVILVTNNYHMPRSLLEMGRLIGDARLEPYPVVNSDLSRLAWLSRPDAMRVLFNEYLKYIAALAGFSPRVNPAAYAKTVAAN
jgi:uncharacterized SAM-binding protein YcdF (DUF218 family)